MTSKIAQIMTRTPVSQRQYITWTGAAWSKDMQMHICVSFIKSFMELWLPVYPPSTSSLTPIRLYSEEHKGLYILFNEFYMHMHLGINIDIHFSHWLLSSGTHDFSRLVSKYQWREFPLIFTSNYRPGKYSKFQQNGK